MACIGNVKRGLLASGGGTILRHEGGKALLPFGVFLLEEKGR